MSDARHVEFTIERDPHRVVPGCGHRRKRLPCVRRRIVNGQVRDGDAVRKPACRVDLVVDDGDCHRAARLRQWRNAGPRVGGRIVALDRSDRGCWPFSDTAEDIQHPVQAGDSNVIARCAGGYGVRVVQPVEGDAGLNV